MVLVRICDVYAKILDKLILYLGLFLIFAVALQVAGRYIPFVPRWLWPLELATFDLIWIVFIGSILALREKRHFNVDLFIGKKISPHFSIFLKVVYYFTVGVVTYVFVVFGYKYLIGWGLIQQSEITGMSMGFLYASVPVAGISWALFLAENIYKDITSNRRKAEGR